MGGVQGSLMEKVPIFTGRKWHFQIRIFLLLLLTCIGLTTASPSCNWDRDLKKLECYSIFINVSYSHNDVPLPENNLTNILLMQSPEDVSLVESIEISSSQIPILRLAELRAFPSLRSFSMHFCNTTNMTGPVPEGLRHLDLSHNWLKMINLSTFSSAEMMALETLDLSYNNLTALPNNTFTLKLKSLNVIENPFRCRWVTLSYFSKWYSDPRNKKAFQNIEDTFCRADHDAFGTLSFPSIVKIKQKASEECNLTPCECDLHTTIGNGKFPKTKNFSVLSDMVTFTLKADCSHKNLTELPPISHFTVLLAMEGNQISDLSPLFRDPTYAHIHSLNMNQNEVHDLDSLVNSTFFDRVQNLELKQNAISQLTDRVILNMFINDNAQRISNIALGNNIINCDCDTFTRLKPRLVVHEDIIRDWKTIMCRSPNVSLLDLRYDQVCDVEVEQSELVWNILIGVEVLCILLVLGTLFRDQRTYRRTGVLPRYSDWIPRLPCDFMLERIKDHHLDPQHHHQSASKV